MHFHFAGTATVAITDGTDNLLLGMLKPPYNTFPPEIIYTHTLILSQYLLNGGDIFSLKEIWGHSSLEIVYRYLHFTPKLRLSPGAVSFHLWIASWATSRIHINRRPDGGKVNYTKITRRLFPKIP
jgi:hypothetical protein